MWLPLANWTERYEQIGNGGFAGSIRYVYDIASLQVAVSNYNAAASTDDGSSVPAGSPSGSFALGHPQRINDYGYRAVHRTALDAQVIATAFYGTQPQHNYFNGCSKGGGEGLGEAQRFPEDFDGILAGDALQDGVSFVAQGLANALLVTNPDNPAGFISSSSLGTITNTVLSACASAQTVPTDSFLGNPPQCHFNTQSLASILTPAQIELLNGIYGGPVTSTDALVAPGYEPEADRWDTNITEMTLTAVPSTSNFVGANESMMYFLQNPTFNWLVDFDIDTSPGIYNTFPIVPPSPGSKLQTVGASDDATNPDLSAFAAHGGKLIQYHGWVDPVVPPLNSVNYFESVVALAAHSQGDEQKALTKTQSYYRLFMAPGMGHCRFGPGINEFGKNGGSGPASSDMFSALEAWVEHDGAPSQVIGWHCLTQNQATGTTCPITQGTFTRPLCPYPQQATYIGSGSTTDAANFVCR